MIIRVYLTKADNIARSLTEIDTKQIATINADDYSITYFSGFGEHFEQDYFNRFIAYTIRSINMIEAILDLEQKSHPQIAPTPQTNQTQKIKLFDEIYQDARIQMMRVADNEYTITNHPHSYTKNQFKNHIKATIKTLESNYNPPTNIIEKLKVVLKSLEPNKKDSK